MSDPSAALLARWLEAPAPSEPPAGLEPEVVEAVYALSPARAPAARLDVDALLGSLRSGPLAAPSAVAAPGGADLAAAPSVGGHEDLYEDDDLEDISDEERAEAAAFAAGLSARGDGLDRLLDLSAPPAPASPTLDVNALLGALRAGPLSAAPAASPAAASTVGPGADAVGDRPAAALRLVPGGGGRPSVAVSPRRWSGWAAGVGAAAVAAAAAMIVLPTRFSAEPTASVASAPLDGGYAPPAELESARAARAAVEPAVVAEAADFGADDDGATTGGVTDAVALGEPTPVGEASTAVPSAGRDVEPATLAMADAGGGIGGLDAELGADAEVGPSTRAPERSKDAAPAPEPQLAAGTAVAAGSTGAAATTADTRGAASNEGAGRASAPAAQPSAVVAQQASAPPARAPASYGLEAPNEAESLPDLDMDEAMIPETAPVVLAEDVAVGVRADRGVDRQVSRESRKSAPRAAPAPARAPSGSAELSEERSVSDDAAAGPPPEPPPGSRARLRADHPELAATFDRAQQALDQGDSAGAQAALGPLVGHADPNVGAFAALSLGRDALRRGADAEARAFAKRGLSRGGAARRLQSDLRALLAEAELRLGDPEAAERARPTDPVSNSGGL